MDSETPRFNGLEVLAGGIRSLVDLLDGGIAKGSGRDAALLAAAA